VILITTTFKKHLQALQMMKSLHILLVFHKQIVRLEVVLPILESTNFASYLFAILGALTIQRSIGLRINFGCFLSPFFNLKSKLTLFQSLIEIASS
jgi:hypothetical protein